MFRKLALLFGFLSLTGCGIFRASMIRQFPSASLNTLSFNSPSITIPARSNYTWTFAASGGTPPYVYSVKSGPGSVNASTGVFTAGTATGITSIQAMDSMGHYGIATANNAWLFANAGMTSMVRDASGNLFVGGSFTSLYPYNAPGLIKLNASNGTVALDFNPPSGLGGFPYAWVKLPDGTSILAGLFSTYGGSAANGIVKLDQYGNMITTFDPGGTGFNGAVNALVLDSSGNVFAGGSFTTYRGSPANRIAKLNATTGALDPTFDPAGTGFSSNVSTLAFDPSGNIFVGGQFTTYQGSAANYVAKLDTVNGNLDPTFDPAGTGFGFFVSAVALDGLGNLFVGGDFSTYRGSAANCIAKMDTTNGTLNAVFDPGGTGFNAFGNVATIAFDGLGNLFVGGGFTSYRGSTANRIAKMDTTNGTLDAVFDPGGTGFNSSVSKILLDSSGNLYATGGFSTYGGSSANYIAKMDTTNGTLANTFGVGFTNNGYTMFLDGNYLYVAGILTAYGGIPVGSIVKLTGSNYSVDPTFDPGGTGFNGYTSQLALDGLGNIFVGGGFTTYRGSAANYIAKLDTTNGTLDNYPRTPQQTNCHFRQE